MYRGSGTLIDTVKSAGVNCEFIMLTKYTALDLLREFFQSGGFDYLLKPLEMENMETTLKRLCSKLNTTCEEAQGFTRKGGLA
jgi:YesN/AraC family two-component response regulator